MIRVHTRRLVGALAGAALVVSGGALVSAPAAAGTSWTAPERLSAAGEPWRDPQVAVGPDGTVHAVWTTNKGDSSWIESASRRPGGAWSRPRRISGKQARGAHVAAAPNGTVTVVWRKGGRKGPIQAAKRSKKGKWSSPTKISAGRRQAGGARVAIDAAGTATAIWTRRMGGNWRVQAATRPRSGSWSSPTTLSPAGRSASGAALSVTGGGIGTVVWQLPNVVQASSRPRGGAWSAPVDISPAGQRGGGLATTSAADGSTIAVWVGYDGSNPRHVLSSTRLPAGTWTAPDTVSAPASTSAESPHVAAAPDGTATAVWVGSGAGTDRLQTATRPPGGAWSAPATVAGSGAKVVTPQLVADADGIFTAIWRRAANSRWRIVASSLTPGAAWTAPEPLSAANRKSHSQQLAVGTGGDVHAVWSLRRGGKDRVQAAALDRTSK